MRVYRLSALLVHAGACTEWRQFVAQFETADEVLAAVNADPRRRIGIGINAAYDVREFAWGESLSNDDECYWSERLDVAADADENDIALPLTRTERRRFLALWQRYADAHGLFEDVPDA